MIASDIIEQIKVLSKINLLDIDPTKDPYLQSINHVLRFELPKTGLQFMKKQVIFNTQQRLGNDLHVPILSSYEADYNALVEPVSEQLIVPNSWLEPEMAVNNELVNDFTNNIYTTVYNQGDYEKNQAVLSIDVVPSSSVEKWYDTGESYLSAFKTIFEVFKDGKLLQTKTLTLVDTNSPIQLLQFTGLDLDVDLAERLITINIHDKSEDPSAYKIKITSFDQAGFYYRDKVALIYNNSLFLRLTKSDIESSSADNNNFLRLNALIRYPAIITPTQKLPSIFDNYDISELLAYMSALHLQQDRREVDPTLEAMVKEKIYEFYSSDRQSKSANKEIYKLFHRSSNNFISDEEYYGGYR